ncbi:hypothetical protein MNEG_10388 [Monoraphidium neglectum]|uniref:PAS domain-containing protein n=1 Tax=Monoraphidium neglectum TaxID=145388 RepID=A0A0D2MSU4_9CHLO|nr:hypothetical protein MNEG_10388 [Monoraphidium neglectum]KIY97575.1 hypothetical protein MNEG_10388 [Monoraphidium neglectum]|eukprot:XP_013896595.1 hypothetical protein MNEG_10388 [Monoraphidium neglectum]
MVIDKKGRIQYATSALARMLGYPTAQLSMLELSAIVPPPYGQLHPGYMKDLSKPPPPSSCRAGGVVRLMRANGATMPATLKISISQEGESTGHHVVLPSSEAASFDRVRLELTVTQAGLVEAASAGATKAVFGFSPQALVGKQLSAVINAFDEWGQKFGDDGAGLLVALGVRAAEGGAAADAAWRTSAMALALQQRRRIQPALMQVKLHEPGSATAGDGLASAEGVAAAAAAAGIEAPRPQDARLRVVLWRADAVAGVVEVSGGPAGLAVTRADDAAGLIFGACPKALLKRSAASLLGLPKTAKPADLLTGSDHNSKRGALKAGTGSAPKVGPRKRLTGRHADGAPLLLEIQAAAKHAQGTRRLAVLIKATDPLRIAQWAEADARTELGPPSETSFGGNSSRGPSGPGAPQGPAGASWAGGGLLDIESEASQSEAGQGDGGGDGGGDDDLATDARRSKILRKLRRLLTGTTAQSASIRFRTHTWAVILLALTVHVVGFAVISTQIQSRYA